MENTRDEDRPLMTPLPYIPMDNGWYQPPAKPVEFTKATPLPAAKPQNNGRSIVVTALIAVFKVVKSAKVLQLLASFGSMLLSIFAYSFSLGWMFATGFVVMIVFHEIGHVFMLRRQGIKASMPMFIPFLGAAIFSKGLGDRHQEASSAICGPIFGSAAALLLLGINALLPSPNPFLLSLATTAFLINLFNLIPILPLDGGRVAQAIGPVVNYLGISILLVVTFVFYMPGLLVIAMLVLVGLNVRNSSRLFLGIIVELAFVLLWILPYGDSQELWVNIIDIVVITGLNVLCVWQWRKNPDDSIVSADNRPQLPRGMRVRWAVAYLVLGAVLVAVTVYSQAELRLLFIG